MSIRLSALQDSLIIRPTQNMLTDLGGSLRHST